MKLPLRIAHRGASGAAPENTLAAIDLALSQGAELIEVDVRATADGALMLLHDDRVDRTTDGSGKLTDLTLEEAQRLDAGSKFSAEFAGERIPTLRQALERVRGRALLFVELKDTGLEKAVVELLRCTDSLSHVAMQSFDFPTIQRLRELEPRLNCGLLMDPKTPAHTPKTGEWIAGQVARHGAGIAALSGELLLSDPSLVRDLQRRGIAVWVWTLNKPEEIQLAVAAGVDGIISNFPDRLPHP